MKSNETKRWVFGLLGAVGFSSLVVSFSEFESLLLADKIMVTSFCLLIGGAFGVGVGSVLHGKRERGEWE